MRISRTVLSLALLPLFCVAARADVKPHALFTDNCVLQQASIVPVWGAAADGEKVTVEFQGQKQSAVAENGKWMVKLRPLRAGGPFRMKISGRNAIVINNVLVGEVWLASGQSNMEWSLDKTVNAEEVMAAATHPRIRLFTVPRNPQDAPATEVAADWSECTPASVKKFSAVAYYFARSLQQSRNGVPIGLIHSSFGGTQSEAWTSRQTFESAPAFAVARSRYAKAVADYPEAKLKFQTRLVEWEREAALAKDQGKPAPPRPGAPYGPENNNRPAGLYNGMIAPLVPYAIRGVIWYQGESNRGRAYEYREIFPLMIRDWRSAWGQGDFPFLFVQLAPYLKIESEPKDSDLAELREAQTLAARRVPHTAVVVVTDVGEEDDIHPRQKAPVGERLATAARAVAYGEKIEYSGPLYAKMKIEGGRALISFEHVGGGLVAKGGKLTGFTIAGDDGKFVPAEALIEGDRVVVFSSRVPAPVAVRFGWANYPVVNLWNKADLPASPFRTDDLPMITDPTRRTGRE